ncbi:MAG: hypothetical protein CM15mP64_4790 [Candidatus Neomarinimicrobiota bacterium]|nr:MAG: hypothetical protein CM15mP64_4790 [Candidatus Neomarinimicrobiota bacterium]
MVIADVLNLSVMSDLKRKNKWTQKYLDSILINHDRSGFCILEFNIPSPSQSLNPKVIMSSGNSFNDIALSILRTINWKTKMNGKPANNNRVRLPVYFKN